jgi:hypothetical protein
MAPGTYPVSIAFCPSSSTCYGAELTTITVAAGGKSTDLQNALTGGNSVLLDASYLPATTTGVTSIASHDFANGMEAGWLNAPPRTTQCGQQQLLGFASAEFVRTFATTATHAYLRFTFEMYTASWGVPMVDVDGVAYPINSYVQAYTSTCASGTSRTQQYKGYIVVPHTAATARITLRVTHGGYAPIALASYAVDTLTATPVAVAIGGSACAVQYATAFEVRCGPVPAAQAAGDATLSMTVNGVDQCSGCTFTYASSVPVVTAAAANGMSTLAAPDATAPQLVASTAAATSFVAGSGWTISGGWAFDPVPVTINAAGPAGQFGVSATFVTMGSEFGLTTTNIPQIQEVDFTVPAA